MSDELRVHAAHRADMQAKAAADMAAIGIDAAFLDRLVDTFYGRVRAHPALGPVFEARLAGRWPEHLARMKRFWQAVALRNGAYSGRPVPAHLAVSGLSEPLFADWLALFGETLDDIAPTQAARDVLMASAERIARSLILSIFHNPAVTGTA
ncbi:group III truncated hemoglobin [Rhizobiaceae bacterium BDR2-2]|uniref:Group III truncated hemoglobin n=1 Tax=Ectorhizobium quercum TaxID=2965071 RepID=A0AAE3MZV2_9HYPH|nr:group III truncated hemoglobin [Ectorhizobium quercum]MCX8997999.1 group III truncated hemoglobin [Ectorhizobium quercum]